jgi:hypothetical protein
MHMATTEALSTLAQYLELSLDDSCSVIMMQRCDGLCAVYIGDATKDQGHWEYSGVIAALIAGDILKMTRSGSNRIEIDGRKYRFVRSPTHFEDRGAIVFRPRKSDSPMRRCWPAWENLAQAISRELHFHDDDVFGPYTTKRHCLSKRSKGWLTRVDVKVGRCEEV